MTSLRSEDNSGYFFLTLYLLLWRTGWGLVVFASGNMVSRVYGATELLTLFFAWGNFASVKVVDRSRIGHSLGLLYVLGAIVVPTHIEISPIREILLVLVGFAVAIVCVSFGVRYSISNPTYAGLYDRGAYRFIRHPQLLLVLVARWVFVAGNLSALNVVTSSVVTLACILSVLVEERFLRRFPDWLAYSARVRWRWLPGLW